MLLRRLLLWLLGDFLTVDRWFHAVVAKHCRTVWQRREAELALRDFKARQEIVRMAELLADCQEAAQRGAAISTTRRAAKGGIDQETALVILQRLYYSQRSR